MLKVPPVVTDRERADEWAGQWKDLLLDDGGAGARPAGAGVPGPPDGARD